MKTAKENGKTASETQEKTAAKATDPLIPKVLQQDIISLWKTYKKTFLYLLILHIIGISAIIRANVSYIDDVGRSALGYRNFGYGRDLANFLASLAHAGLTVRDISPLTQMLAVCFLSAACCIVIHLLSENREFNLWTIIAVLPLGLSPYFLECLSYKFDSPYMALSILVSVLPFLFRKYGLIPYGIASAAGCLAMCALYQSSSGIYPMLTALLCFLQWNKGRPSKDVLRFLLVSASSYCLALIIFRLCFVFGSSDASGYVNYSISLSLLPKNLHDYFSHIKSDFKPWWLGMTALIAASFIYISAYDSVGRPRVLSGFLAAVALLVMLLLSYGAYSVLEAPLMAPRAMYGFGVFIAFISVCISGESPISSIRLACFYLSWSFFVFAFVYGNALADNQRYLEFRAEAAIMDVCETEAFRSVKEDGEKLRIQYFGSISWSPLVIRDDDNHNLLVRLVPNIVSSDWVHGQIYLRWYFGIGDYIIIDSSEDFRELDLPVLKDTFYHTIRGDGERILIEFKH